MERREFIVLLGSAATAWPLGALAQDSPGKVWRVAYLYPGSLANPADRAIFDVFRSELRVLGYIEGKNLALDSRSADGNAERLPALVRELIR
jgi:putative ABC transport system substrate-binding protein